MVAGLRALGDGDDGGLSDAVESDYTTAVFDGWAITDCKKSAACVMNKPIAPQRAKPWRSTGTAESFSKNLRTL